MTTPYAVRDIVEIVTRAGERLDCLMIPKVEGADHVHFVHHLLRGLEREVERRVPVGLEVLIESPRGAVAVRDIVTASDRIEALIFGVGDYEVTMDIPRFAFGVADPGFPGVQWLWVMSEIANHARAHGIEAIDGPYVAFHDEPGYLESARRGKHSASRASGASTEPDLARPRRVRRHRKEIRMARVILRLHLRDRAGHRRRGLRRDHDQRPTASWRSTSLRPRASWREGEVPPCPRSPDSRARR